MQEINYRRQTRIEIVDAIRGFALLGILLLHSIEHFDFLRVADLNPRFFAPIDPIIDGVIRFMFSGKAYSMFSLMFGFSFFIQMDRQEQRGVDFRGKFLWRLAILFVLGYLHGLLYSGDILKIYAVLGIPLVLLYNRKSTTLIWLAVLLILQIPTIYNLIYSFTNPGYVFDRTALWQLWGQAEQTFATGSLLEVMRFNSYKGILAVWAWMYFNGRYLQLIGLFIFGLVVGKSRYFEQINQHKKWTRTAFFGSIIIFGIFMVGNRVIPYANMVDTQSALLGTLIQSYSNFAFTIILMSGFILLYGRVKNWVRFTSLAAYGKMSLTSYVTQALIGVPFFYGFGLAMYHYFGPTLSVLYGIVYFVFQITLCRYWLNRFYYGPLEWIWRAITYLDFGIRFRKPAREEQAVDAAGVGIGQ